jgi:RHS repeat-associated protein
LKAVAFRTGWTTSGVASGPYDNSDPGLAPIGPKHGQRRSARQSATSTRVVSYTLDNAGNRTQVVDAGVTKSYVPNSLNEYTTGHGSAVTNGLSHEISSYNGTSYNYIGDSYLAKATASTNTLSLYYDALGRCVKRTLNGVSNYYVFDGEHWVVEYDASNVITSNACYGRVMDELIARYNGSAPSGKQSQWFFPDRNGNTSVVTDGVNGVLESYRYDAFGLPTIYGPTGTVLGATAISNRFLFTGREWRLLFGFYEYRARAYNPTIGRFMSEDPKGFNAGDYNLYRYCANDPLDLTDPMGLDIFGQVTIDHDGDPHAYAVRGSGNIGHDSLANATHLSGPLRGQLSANVVMFKSGKPVIREGYYVSRTSWHRGEHAVNPEKVPYIALGTKQQHDERAAGKTQTRGWFNVVNPANGKSVPAVFADSRGSAPENNRGVEISPAAARAVGLESGQPARAVFIENSRTGFPVDPMPQKSGK